MDALAMALMWGLALLADGIVAEWGLGVFAVVSIVVLSFCWWAVRWR